MPPVCRAPPSARPLRQNRQPAEQRPAERHPLGRPAAQQAPAHCQAERTRAGAPPPPVVERHPAAAQARAGRPRAGRQAAARPPCRRMAVWRRMPACRPPAWAPPGFRLTPAQAATGRAARRRAAGDTSGPAIAGDRHCPPPRRGPSGAGGHELQRGLHLRRPAVRGLAIFSLPGTNAINVAKLVRAGWRS